MTRLGLRLDQVVIRVLDDLRRCVDARATQDLTVVLTLTAPIRRPSKLVVALEREIAELLKSDAGGLERSAFLDGNRVELRLVEHAPGRGHKLVGLVHNSDVDPARLLALAEQWLRSSA